MTLYDCAMLILSVLTYVLIGSIVAGLFERVAGEELFDDHQGFVFFAWPLLLLFLTIWFIANINVILIPCGWISKILYKLKCKIRGDVNE